MPAPLIGGAFVQWERMIAPNKLEEPNMATTTKTKTQKKPLTKREQLMQLLGKAEGVTVNEVSEALDWLPHTVRAALTRVRAGVGKLEKLPPADGERYARYRLEKA